jgi:transcriptional regulator with XRE-family HTH domain
MPTTETGHAPRETRAQAFADWIRPAVVAAGYDIDSPRGGGKKELALATGMSQSSIGRMLSGQTMPDPLFLEKLAGALRLPLTELLVRAGVVSSRRGMGGSDTTPPPPASLTLEQHAHALGIRSPDRVKVFKAMVETLRAQEEEK